MRLSASAARLATRIMTEGTAGSIEILPEAILADCPLNSLRLQPAGGGTGQSTYTVTMCTQSSQGNILGIS